MMCINKDTRASAKKKKHARNAYRPPIKYNKLVKYVPEWLRGINHEKFQSCWLFAGFFFFLLSSLLMHSYYIWFVFTIYTQLLILLFRVCDKYIPHIGQICLERPCAFVWHVVRLTMQDCVCICVKKKILRCSASIAIITMAISISTQWFAIRYCLASICPDQPIIRMCTLFVWHQYIQCSLYM